MSVCSAGARQQQRSNRGLSSLVQSLFISGSPCSFPIIPLKCFSPSLKPHKHSQGGLTNGQPELTLLKDLGKLWSQGRGTAIHSGPPWPALASYCLCTRTNVTPALLCPLSGGSTHSLSLACFKVPHRTELSLCPPPYGKENSTVISLQGHSLRAAGQSHELF